MTIKLKPDCELQKAIARLVAAAKDYQDAWSWDNEQPISETRMQWRKAAKVELSEARAHLLEVIHGKIELALLEKQDHPGPGVYTTKHANEIMGVVSDD